ncbi:MAG: hypothetical protein GX596_11045 [Propionibacterium sp.]|nr:hypothetical protein [Propionibacterium sp.]
MLRIRVGQSWRAMVGALAGELREAMRTPFDTVRVIVDSPGSARLLSQEIAAVDGIAAGIRFVTPRQFRRELAESAGVLEQYDAWHSPRLVTAVWESLGDVAPDHALLGRFLARPGRRLSAAARLARLLRSYVDEAPELVAAWMAGDDDALPRHLSWQPALLRRTAASLGFDPLRLAEALRGAAERDATGTWLFGVDEVPRADVALVAAARPHTAWFVRDEPAWLDGVAREPAERVGKPLRAAPVTEVHGSHSRLRQAEVLRDALTRCFEEDPALEARDVRIVTPDPTGWAPVINAVFRGDGSHPGQGLRVAEVAPAVGGNLALEALEAAFAILDDRATATQVVEFLLMPAISRRWGFAQSREDLLQLVSDAQIRWGLDAAQRGRFGLPNTEFNTWFRGLDALLTGVAMGAEIGPPGVAGVETTTSNDLPLIGSLSEVVSRLRALAHATRDELSVPAWCDLATRALEELVGLGYEDAWMERQALTSLDRLARSHAHSGARFNRREFRRLLLADLPARWHRPAIGNGGLHVVAPGEIRHVDAKVVAFVGLGDATERALPDEVPGALPDVRSRRLHLALAHARAAERLIIVTGTRSERTGAPLEMPVAIAWLGRELGVDVTPQHHAPQPFNAGAFAPPGSFDRVAFEGAVRSHEHAERPVEVRRREAMALPVGETPARVSLEELGRFLRDPLKAFLRSSAGIRWFDDPRIDDAVPLRLGSLEEWQVTDAFIQGLLRHDHPQQLTRRELARQIFPPSTLGASLADQVGERAWLVAEAAGERLSDRLRHVPVRLELGGTTLTGVVGMHGDALVRPAASKRSGPLLVPWLETLALAASGIPATGEVIRPTNQNRARRSTLRQPSPERATELLELYLRAMRIGTSRLLPVPWDAGYQLATELSRGQFLAANWTDPPPFAFRKWFPDELWSLFYADPLTELLKDPADADAPVGDGSSTFERWAAAMYLPLIEAGGTW